MLGKYRTFQDLILEFCDTCEIYYTGEIVMLFVVDRFTTPPSGCPYLRGVNLNFLKKIIVYV